MVRPLWIQGRSRIGVLSPVQVARTKTSAGAILDCLPSQRPTASPEGRCEKHGGYEFGAPVVLEQWACGGQRPPPTCREPSNFNAVSQRCLRGLRKPGGTFPHTLPLAAVDVQHEVGLTRTSTKRHGGACWAQKGIEASVQVSVADLLAI